MLLLLLKQLRVKDYIKNGFVIAPIFFSGELFYNDNLIFSILGFFSFSLISSSVYIINDIVDLEYDKQHPTNRYRPLASGKLSIHICLIVLVASFCTSIFISLIISNKYLYIILFYFVLNLAYAKFLKNFGLIDILVISMGFILRVFAGSSIIEMPPSMWILLITFLIAMYLGFAKRLNELKTIDPKIGIARKSLNFYSIDFLKNAMVMISSTIIVSYVLYVNSIIEFSQNKFDYLFLSVVLVVAGFLRYLQISLVFEKPGSPSEIVLTDKFIIVIIILFILIFGYTTYF